MRHESNWEWFYFSRDNKFSFFECKYKGQIWLEKNIFGVRRPEFLAYSHVWFSLSIFFIYKIMKIIAYTCGRLITLMIIINGIPVATIFLSHGNFGVSHETCFGQQDSSKPCTLKLEKVLLLFCSSALVMRICPN